MTDYLPPLWSCVGAALVVGAVICTVEDMRHGPMTQARKKFWTDRYVFWLEYTARVVLVGGGLLVSQAILSAAWRIVGAQ